MLPDLSGFRMGQGNLKGLRFIHSHLKGAPLDQEDIADLRMLRLDLVGVLNYDSSGIPGVLSIACIDPTDEITGCGISAQSLEAWLQVDYEVWISELTTHLQKTVAMTHRVSGKTRAIVVVVAAARTWDTQALLEEIVELAEASGVEVVGNLAQKVRRVHPAYLIGEGKLKELVMASMEKGVDCIIFNRDLSPAQLNAISRLTELKIIDRTLLILDIFARRAHSREGKLQVELAQLQYMLPRLGRKNTAMSRLTGGIGGRGPGETKLEINRRRVRNRIASLKKGLKHLKSGRELRRKRRKREALPIVSIVGYTNAGKSTLLNALTNSHVFVEGRPFATLDTASRLLRFPKDRKVIITDTVGFIRDLPADLLGAFMSTLDELKDADLLVHLVDLSHPDCEHHMRVVEKILQKIGISEIPRLLVLNKTDKIPAMEARKLSERYRGIPVSALDRKTLIPLIEAVKRMAFPPPAMYSVTPLINQDLI